MYPSIGVVTSMVNVLTVKRYIKKLLTDSMVQIEPTRRCNFHCVHCTHKNETGCIDIGTYRKLLLKHKDCKVVKLQGLGEPLLHPNIQQLIDMAKDKGHRVMIITNGSFPYVSNVDHYVFSLETTRPEVFESLGKSNLPRVLENIKLAASYQKIIINCVLNYKTTPQHVEEVARFADEIKADMWITPQEVWVHGTHEAHDDHVQKTKLAWNIHGVKENYRKYRVCTWGVSEFYYDYTGAVHPCCIRMTDEYKGMSLCEWICKGCPL